MFIRKKSKKKNGKKYYQYQLVKSYRTPEGPRQKVILNMGSELEVEDDKLTKLSNLIEDKVNGNIKLFPLENELQKYAEHYASLLIEKRLKEEGEEIQEEDSPRIEEVDINSTENKRFKTIGPEHAILSEINRYKLLDKLKEIGFSKIQAKRAVSLIIGRAVHPSSERETARWLRDDSGLDELLDTDFSELSDNSLHRAADALFENKDEIESYLTSKSHQLYNLDDKIILYDLTNTFFETSKKDNKLAQFGKSKERRNDCPLVSLALVTDKHGFPKKSRIYKGNVSEYSTLEDILKDLGYINKELEITTPTVVLDSGIASEENLELLKRENFKYVVVSNKKSQIDELNWDEDWDKLQMQEDKSLYVKSSEMEGEQYLLCLSERKLKKEEEIYKRRIEKFESAIEKIEQGLHVKRRLKSYDKVLEKIGRLKEKYKVGNLYDIEFKQDDDSQNATAINLNKKENKCKDLFDRTGKYLLRTNRTDLSKEEISRIHRSLTQVEKSFRCMKSDLGLRPIEHQNDNRIKAHIFITVLAYYMISGILYMLRGNEFLPNSWESICNLLSTHLRGITSFETTDGYRIDLKNNTVPTVDQRKIYNTLGIKNQPKPNKYLKTKLK